MQADFNGTFFITISGIVTAFLGVVLRYAYKSKCHEVSLCGLRIKRDVIVEMKEDLERGNSDTTGTPKSSSVLSSREMSIEK